MSLSARRDIGHPTNRSSLSQSFESSRVIGLSQASDNQVDLAHCEACRREPRGTAPSVRINTDKLRKPQVHHLKDPSIKVLPLVPAVFVQYFSFASYCLQNWVHNTRDEENATPYTFFRRGYPGAV
jgi:hypothetical protein